jgi:prepilin-type N-terminal cleavage/methylation domain-containing protein
MTSKFVSSQEGMTLLETMIALLVFSVGVLGVASMQVGSMQMNAKAHWATCDIVAASEYLEAILSLPFDDPLLEDPDDGFAPGNPDHGPFKLPIPLSTIEWEVDDQFPAPNTKRVSVTVRKSGNTSSSKVFTYEYIKAKGFM